jgi:hypothetical protein
MFRVGMLGPSRVGKTSLVVSVLTDAERIFGGLPVTLRAADGPTRERAASPLPCANSSTWSSVSASSRPGTPRSGTDRSRDSGVSDPRRTSAGRQVAVYRA